MTSRPKEEREDMAEAIKYIKSSGKYEKFYEWKKKTKSIFKHKGILKYLTKEVETLTEEEAENYEDKMKIYEGNSKAWYFLIIILTDIHFGMFRQFDDIAHDTWKVLLDKYEVSYEKQ